MQKIISWNVASVRARLGALTNLLQKEDPDIVLLQEIKAEEHNFPFMELKALGYYAYINGQKSYNGVAILSKIALSDIKIILPDFSDDDTPQARFIEGKHPSGMKIISVYVPNGNPPEKEPNNTSKLEYKLRWMEAFNNYIRQTLFNGEKVVVGGDFNVIEKDTDVYNPEAFRNNALMLECVRDKYAELNALPIVNAIRLMNPEPHTYSFWDFQMLAWQLNRGILLDALFVNASQEKRIIKAGVLKEVRGWEKTSDHAPIYLILND